MSDARPDVTKPNDNRLAAALAQKLIHDLRLGDRKQSVVAVAGESGSGKSVTATDLARELGAARVPATVIHQDDYFHLPPRTNHENRVLDLRNVGPHEVNLALLQSHVDAFRAGEPGVEAPAVDYPANRFVTQRYDFTTISVLIVEGTYVFRLHGLDVRIFLEATHEDTRERRRIRNRDIDAPIIDQILAIEHDIIAKQAAQADILIDQNFRIR